MGEANDWEMEKIEQYQMQKYSLFSPKQMKYIRVVLASNIDLCFKQSNWLR